jgi:leucyl-tRNA synthetase
MAEELWSRIGNAPSISTAAWPSYDPAMLVDDTIELPVQIQGKVKARLVVPANADAAAIEALVLADAEVQKQIAGRPIRKIVVVPGRMVNVVV